MNENKKTKYLSIAAVIILVIAGGVWFVTKSSVGNGLVGTIFGSNSPEQQTIKETLAVYFGKTKEDSNKVTVSNMSGNYAEGDFNFGDTQTGSFFAIKKDLNWTIPFTTTKDFVLLCATVASYGFPKEIPDQCANPDGTVTTRTN